MKFVDRTHAYDFSVLFVIGLPGSPPLYSRIYAAAAIDAGITHRDFHQTIALPGCNSDPFSLRSKLDRIG
jgi:hypothetical protein